MEELKKTNPEMDGHERRAEGEFLSECWEGDEARRDGDGRRADLIISTDLQPARSGR